MANEAVDGVNVIDVAAEAVVANEADTTLLAQLLVPKNVPVNDPLKLPVLICTELDTVPSGSPDERTKDAVVANDAVAGVNVILVAAEDVVANDAEVAFCAQLLVPVN